MTDTVRRYNYTMVVVNGDGKPMKAAGDVRVIGAVPYGSFTEVLNAATTDAFIKMTNDNVSDGPYDVINFSIQLSEETKP